MKKDARRAVDSRSTRGRLAQPLFHLALARFDAVAREERLALRGHDDAPIGTRMGLWDLRKSFGPLDELL